MMKFKKYRSITISPRTRVLFLSIGGPALAVLVFLFVVFWMPNETTDPSGIVVTISRGASFSSVVDSLSRAGVIRSRLTFQLAGRLLGYTKQIRVGKYLFAGGQSNLTILKDVREGRSRMIISVTIPEGWRMESIARRFHNELDIDEARFLSACRDSHFVRQQGLEGPTLEGYLMPDTYAFYWQTDEHEVVGRMLQQFRMFYADSLRAKQRELRLSLLQVVTLAAIVEAESGVDAERPVIAGVYWNRLRKNMRLEADPTIQYVLPDGPRRLTFRDLELDSPYNTYRRYGLPPGPINNPGRGSITSVLFPADHRYLYFVATGSGGHRFSASFSEHQRAIQLYHQARREARRQARARAQAFQQAAK
jgi:UPF0755 protein